VHVTGLDGSRGLFVYEVQLDEATVRNDPNYLDGYSVVSRSGSFKHKVLSFTTVADAESEVARLTAGYAPSSRDGGQVADGLTDAVPPDDA
jgi:hypothetical protein